MAGSESHGSLPVTGSRAAERDLIEPPEYKSFPAIEVLAASLVMRLTVDDLERLGRELQKRTEERRRQAAREPLPVLTGCRDAWETP